MARNCVPQSLIDKLERKKARLETYRKREEYLLSDEGVKSYGIGSRNVTRYDTALADITKQIDKLEQEIEDLENLICRGSKRKSFGVVPRDDY